MINMCAIDVLVLIVAILMYTFVELWINARARGYIELIT